MTKPRSIFPVHTADDEEQLYFKMIDEALISAVTSNIGES